MATFLGLIVMLTLNLISQEERHERPMGENKEKLKAHKIAFITDRLQLTPAEAEKFWPVYNEHEAAMETMHKVSGKLMILSRKTSMPCPTPKPMHL